MRIGLFTDTYHPTLNGITFVVESLKRNLEADGHEVYVFCPAKSLRPSRDARLVVEDDRIRRLPSFPSGFFEDFDFTVFFPPRILREIKAMELDVIHIFTPSQVGMLGINAAVKSDVPFVVQHSTDLYQYVKDYPNVFPGALALVSIVLPTHTKLNGKDIKEIIKLYRPRRELTKWNQQIIAKGLTMAHSKADAVIALSRKSEKQLRSWQEKSYRYKLTLMPNGVNAIPKPTKAKQQAFNDQWGIGESDEVFGFVGRLAAEKNLPLLIKAMDKVGEARPRAKLMFVGDFEYRQALEEMAAASRFPDRIIFTGALPRHELGVAYGAFDVFCFPSMTDTQGWVLHEAAHASLPIVVCDTGVSEVVKNKKNGFHAKSTPSDFASKVVELLSSPKKRANFGAESKRLASLYTEKRQILLLEELYHNIIERHKNSKRSSVHPIKRLGRQLLRRKST